MSHLLSKALFGCASMEQKQLMQIRLSYFERFGALLEGCEAGPTWLKEREVAESVQEAIRHRDGKVYDLFAYCIMPNHVHMVFSTGHVGRVAGPTTAGRDAVPSYISTMILGSLPYFSFLNFDT
ncbi:MAG: transposase [Bacteroidetes bacterium]|nr:transposase [Bacteroidota bacterium]